MSKKSIERGYGEYVDKTVESYNEYLVKAISVLEGSQVKVSATIMKILRILNDKNVTIDKENLKAFLADIYWIVGDIGNYLINTQKAISSKIGVPVRIEEE